MKQSINTTFMATVKRLKVTSGARTREAVEQIEDRIYRSGRCTPREQEFLDRFGKIDQKEVF